MKTKICKWLQWTADDTIYAKGGDDIILSDTPSGNITTSFYIDASTFKDDGSEKLIINIEDLPQGFSSLESNLVIIQSNLHVRKELVA